MKKICKYTLMIMLLLCITGCLNNKKQLEEDEHSERYMVCSDKIGSMEEDYFFTYDKDGKEILNINYSYMVPIEDDELENESIEDIVKKHQEYVCKDDYNRDIKGCKVTSSNNNIVVTMVIDVNNLDEELPYNKYTGIDDIERVLGGEDSSMTVSCVEQ